MAQASTAARPIRVVKYPSGRLRYYHEHPASPWRLESRRVRSEDPVIEWVEFRSMGSGRWDCPECGQTVVEEAHP